jgi:aryl-alcohol dehydrogenase-like predicted oxidoreductase
MPSPTQLIEPVGLRLVLGGNVFGWTADLDTSFAILDAFYDAGGRMIDTAEGYSDWIPGHVGGESETVLGKWMAARGNRADMHIATKTGMYGKPGDLAPAKVAAAVEGSLKRLQTDYIDLYYAHRDEQTTDQAEAARGFGALVSAGKVRALGASNFTAERLASARAAAIGHGLAPCVAIQNEYNLVVRNQHEGPVQDMCVAEGIASFPYFGLASGFLTGKYRVATDLDAGPRGYRVRDYFDKGQPILAAMDKVVAETGAKHAHVALAWINAQPGIAAPIASASRPEQVADLVAGATLVLAQDHLDLLNAAKPLA